MSKALCRTAVFLSLGFLAQTVLASEPAENCTSLDCLLCPAMQDPDSYLEGNMKLINQLTPGTDRWLFRSDVDLTNEFGMPARMQPEFARLVETFSAQGTRLAMVVQPTRGLMHRDKIRPDFTQGFDYATAADNLRTYLQQMRDAGAIVPDIMQLVENPPAEEYFFRRDHHWTSAGARNTARLLADHLMQQPVYAELPRKAYRTETGVTLFKDGTLNLALSSLCGNNYGFQYVQGYRTVPEISDASALFDEEPVPEVILVGTSNSATRDEENKQFNFDGFIKEFLSVDLLNFAMPGAGEYGALIEYLHSDSYSAAAPPKLIVWELPANYRLADPLMYRQLIPAIEGQCSNEAALLSNQLEKTSVQVNERIELLSNTGDERLEMAGHDVYLDIRLSNGNLKHFYLIVYYDNGKRDKVWIRREAIVSGGQYYLELSKDPEFRNANLLSVFMEPTEALQAPVNMEVRLCGSRTY
ncbi:alginate O-acetyltransferase AlgX-related protein [Halopseudomonas salegens]|uniref:alginate O-acetyltransferase AlgX-related protein n=1 Tax=Halopseudomonas salegens TaxID=1434072 RepID=UPI001E3F36FD|nr:alginate biosynthesis protein AlgX [Halopseudomonas salegens]